MGESAAWVHEVGFEISHVKDNTKWIHLAGN